MCILSCILYIFLFPLILTFSSFFFVFDGDKLLFHSQFPFRFIFMLILFILLSFVFFFSSFSALAAFYGDKFVSISFSISFFFFSFFFFFFLFFFFMFFSVSAALYGGKFASFC